LAAQQVGLRVFGDEALHRDVEVVLQGQGQRVCKRQLQPPVADEAFDARRVFERRGGYRLGLPGAEDAAEGESFRAGLGGGGRREKQPRQERRGQQG